MPKDKGEYKLKELDKKILYILDSESAISLTKMAKMLKTSPQLVEYRVNNLVEKGIIKSFLTITEYKREGYTNHLVYIKFRGVLPKKEEEIVEFLRKQPLVNIILRCDGKWDIGIGILARTPFELDEVISKIHGKYGEYIDDQAVNTHVGAEHYRRHYLLSKHEAKEYEVVPTTGKKISQIDVDNTDRKILYAIHENARLPMTEIAAKTGLSVDIVRYRTKKLRENGIIMGSTFLPDYKKYGYLLYRILLILKHQPKAKKQLFEYARKHPNVFRVIHSFGRYNGIIDVEIENPVEMRKFLLDLRNRFKDSLVAYDSLYVHECSRFSYYPHGPVKKA